MFQSLLQPALSARCEAVSQCYLQGAGLWPMFGATGWSSRVLHHGTQCNTVFVRCTNYF